MLALAVSGADRVFAAETPPDLVPPAAPVANPTATPVQPAVHAKVDKGELLGHIKHLASESFRGREAGTSEQLKAAAYIADEFKRYGLRPMGDKAVEAAEPGYLQTFFLPVSKGLGAGNALKVEAGGKTDEFKVKTDFTPLPANRTSPHVAEAGVVFAGYGISAPEHQYDDFAGVELAGKWALIFRYEPQDDDPKSRFQGKTMTRHAHFATKVNNCALRRAAGVLIVNAPQGAGAEDKLLDPVGPCFAEVELPVLMLTRPAADAILKSSGKTVAELQAAIDKDLKPQSRELAGVKVGAVADLVIDPQKTSNVLAVLEGSDPELKQEYVVIGAHCDHVGMGNFGSLMGRLGAGLIHPGADDNASGTAALLEVAQFFGALKPEERPRRSLFFQAYSGEEKGLLGSQYYVDHPSAPLAKHVAMINMDMVGRSHNGAVQISGVGTAERFRTLVEKYGAQEQGLTIFLSSSGVAPSDNTTFYRKDIPVLFFFTGTHPDYHKASDTWDKINAPAAEAIARLVASVAREIADTPERPKFLKSGAQGYLGVSPDRERLRDAKGFPVGPVQAGSPAEQAGLQAGDTIVEAGGTPLAHARDLNMALIGYAPGDQIELSVQRGTDTFKLRIILAERGK
ncbi:MAG: hypothetical protein AMXMBFR7_08880 [Planctomycetota bacterium]